MAAVPAEKRANIIAHASKNASDLVRRIPVQRGALLADAPLRGLREPSFIQGGLPTVGVGRRIKFRHARRCPESHRLPVRR